jgi:hypothetical protein
MERPYEEHGFDVVACRICGCTDEEACPGGCCWVEDPSGGDLCSSCVAHAIALTQIALTFAIAEGPLSAHELSQRTGLSFLERPAVGAASDAPSVLDELVDLGLLLCEEARCPRLYKLPQPSEAAI